MDNIAEGFLRFQLGLPEDVTKKLLSGKYTLSRSPQEIRDYLLEDIEYNNTKIEKIVDIIGFKEVKKIFEEYFEDEKKVETLLSSKALGDFLSEVNLSLIEDEDELEREIVCKLVEKKSEVRASKVLGVSRRYIRSVLAESEGE